MSGPIVVGVDGSDTAKQAAHMAAALARALGRSLHVVTAYEKDEVTVLEVGSDVFRFDTEEEAATIATGVGEAVSEGIEIETAAARGKPADALVDEAERVGASLIVVGNRRMQGVSRVLGSVANTVSHNAPCDVYIVKTT